MIDGDEGFTSASGITLGTGTSADPYIIQGWNVSGFRNNSIEIRNTRANFVIRGVYLHPDPSLGCDEDVPNVRFVGLLFHNSSNGRVENSVFSGGCDGTRLESSTNVSLLRNELSHSSSAISVRASSNVGIYGNTLKDSWNNGINVSPFLYPDEDPPRFPPRVDVTIFGNNISNNSVGIYLGFSSHVLIAHNNISNNIRGLEEGFSEGVLVTDNSFIANDYGLVLIFPGEIAITKNDFVSNRQLAIHAQGAGTNVTVHHNNMIGNGVEVHQYPCILSTGCGIIGSWDAGYPRGGNYWSDYSGPDECSGPEQNLCGNPDGIGDSPCTIPILSCRPQSPCVIGATQDRCPLTSPYGVLQARLDLVPDRLASKTNGLYVTAYVELSRGFDVDQVDLGSIRLNATILVAARNKSTVIVDHDGNGISDLMMKFDRQEVERLFNGPGTYTLQLTGHTIVGDRPFAGSHLVTVTSASNNRQPPTTPV